MSAGLTAALAGEAQLRGCSNSSGLDGLTPQQREIAILASHGLTNSEIAGRLFLSPRTVASHLHRCFPKASPDGISSATWLTRQARGRPADSQASEVARQR